MQRCFAPAVFIPQCAGSLLQLALALCSRYLNFVQETVEVGRRAFHPKIGGKHPFPRSSDGRRRQPRNAPHGQHPLPHNTHGVHGVHWVRRNRGECRNRGERGEFGGIIGGPSARFFGFPR